eukprot:4904326-Amphidinium_carterae.1
MAVISDSDGLYDHRTGKAFERQLLEFFEFLTSRRATEPAYFRFYADLQDSCGLRKDGLENRLKQSRAAQHRLWEEKDPDRFESQLLDVFECFQILEQVLSEEALQEEKTTVQSVAYSVRNVERQLQERLNSGGTQPKWLNTYSGVASLAGRLEQLC